MDIYEKFQNNFVDVRKFDWKPGWNVLKGVEEPIDFVKELVDVNLLENYDSKKHLKNSFTGFVNVDKKRIKINGSKEMVEYMYIEKGKIKYFQCYEGYENNYSKKFKFYDENFCLHKGYSSNNEGKLTYVHRNSQFSLNEFNIEYFRCLEEQASIYVGKNIDLFFVLEINGKSADKLNGEIFLNYDNFFNYFKFFKGILLGRREYFNKSFSLEEAIGILNNSKQIKTKNS